MLNRNDPDCQNDIQESRKEHGSLQELPCSPIKEREEVMAMEMAMVMAMKITLIVDGDGDVGVNIAHDKPHANDVLSPGGTAR